MHPDRQIVDGTPVLDWLAGRAGATLPPVSWERCSGPWLALADGGVVFDASGGLGAGGLGFNPAAAAGVVHFEEAWTGRNEGRSIEGVRNAFAGLLLRRLGWNQGSVVFLPDGETAMRAAPQVLQPAGGGGPANRQRLRIWRPFDLDLCREPVGRGPAGVDPSHVDALLVCDERQTACHAGTHMFWHCSANGNCPGMGEGGDVTAHTPLSQPDLVIASEGFGVGVLVSREPVAIRDAFDPAALVRGYITASVLDQFQDGIIRIGEQNRQRLEELRRDFPGFVLDPRAWGQLAAFDGPDRVAADRLAAAAARRGILLGRGVEGVVRFHWNLGIQAAAAEWFWTGLRAACRDVEAGGSSAALAARQPDVEVKEPSGSASGYADPRGGMEVHRRMVELRAGSKAVSDDDRKAEVSRLLLEGLGRAGVEGIETRFPDRHDWDSFRSRVWAMQERVYEPARRTSLETFDRLMRAEPRHAFVLERGDELVAIGFAGPLREFPGERGTLEDPDRNDPEVIYIADLTVDARYRGGLGRLMKQAIALDAMLAGRKAIHGRNRDRLAGGMWAINLSLGSYQTRHLVNDYPDSEQYRDCIYYRCPLRWERRPRLDDGHRCWAGADDIAGGLLEAGIESRCGWNPAAGTAIAAPRGLPHVRLFPSVNRGARGLVAALDRFRGRAGRIVEVGTSVLSRGLGEAGGQARVVCLKNDPSDSAGVLAALRREAAMGDLAAVLISPVCRATMQRWPVEVLEEASGICAGAGGSLILDETFSWGFRYSLGFGSVAGMGRFPVFAVIGTIGPQCTAVLAGAELAMDGHLPPAVACWRWQVFSEAVRRIREHPERFARDMRQFDGALRDWLNRSGAERVIVQNGVGSFWLDQRNSTVVPLESWFRVQAGGRQRICAGWDAARSFLEWLES